MTSPHSGIKRRLVAVSVERLHLVPARAAAAPMHPIASDGHLLPAYPGEMGIEIRYFLGRVEPWLRAGWQVLARRPELYPAGAALDDAALFAAEDALFRRYDADRLAVGPHVRQPERGRLNRVRGVVAREKARRLRAEWRSRWSVESTRRLRVPGRAGTRTSCRSPRSSTTRVLGSTAT